MKRFIQSAKHAFHGVKMVYKEEPNFRIHIRVALLVVLFGFLLSVTLIEWMLLAVVMGLVLVAEIINSLIERLLDLIKPTTNTYIKEMKDVMAAAVVVCAVVSVIVGLIIFLPKIIHILF